MIKNIVTLSTLFLSVSLAGLTAPDTSSWETSPFFNTGTISDTQTARSLLQNEGFAPIRFTTSDGYTLEGLYKEAPRAQATVICCSGFFPGLQEGLATLAKIISPDCNILLFNGRGKGESTGFAARLQLWNYGRFDYLDVVGAVTYAQAHSAAPIILWGTCAGAFHAAKALIHASEYPIMNQVKGLVFDSGWGKVACTAKTAIDAQIKKSISSRVLRAPVRWTVATLRSLFIMPFMHYHNTETTLQGKMHKIQVPVFFIHSKNDQFACYSEVEKLIQETRTAKVWLIEKSSHAAHYLKHKYEYARQLHRFCSEVITF